MIKENIFMDRNKENKSYKLQVLFVDQSYNSKRIFQCLRDTYNNPEYQEEP
jgi:hypothetical protein